MHTDQLFIILVHTLKLAKCESILPRFPRLASVQLSYNHSIAGIFHGYKADQACNTNINITCMHAAKRLLFRENLSNGESLYPQNISVIQYYYLTPLPCRLIHRSLPLVALLARGRSTWSSECSQPCHPEQGWTECATCDWAQWVSCVCGMCVVWGVCGVFGVGELCVGCVCVGVCVKVRVLH